MDAKHKRTRVIRKVASIFGRRTSHQIGRWPEDEYHTEHKIPHDSDDLQTNTCRHSTLFTD